MLSIAAGQRFGIECSIPYLQDDLFAVPRPSRFRVIENLWVNLKYSPETYHSSGANRNHHITVTRPRGNLVRLRREPLRRGR